jgi:polyhydroxyalkanoate synthesis regulator phasin
MLSSDELRNLVSKILADPRVLKLLSSEQLVRVLTLALGAPDRLGELTQDQVSKLMKRFGIAPVERVEELERRVAELEAELSRQRDAD